MRLIVDQLNPLTEKAIVFAKGVREMKRKVPDANQARARLATLQLGKGEGNHRHDRGRRSTTKINERRVRTRAQSAKALVRVNPQRPFVRSRRLQDAQ